VPHVRAPKRKLLAHGGMQRDPQTIYAHQHIHQTSEQRAVAGAAVVAALLASPSFPLTQPLLPSIHTEQKQKCPIRVRHVLTPEIKIESSGAISSS